VAYACGFFYACADPQCHCSEFHALHIYRDPDCHSSREHDRSRLSFLTAFCGTGRSIPLVCCYSPDDDLCGVLSCSLDHHGNRVVGSPLGGVYYRIGYRGLVDQLCDDTSKGSRGSINLFLTTFECVLLPAARLDLVTSSSA